MAARRVLIVGADSELATVYRGALQARGLAVDVAGVDQVGAETASRPPDLLVVDADPTVGDAVCRTVKKKGKQPPVLLVSANANSKRSLFGAHPDLVLQKPVSVELLLQNVARLLGIELRAPSEDAIPLDENLLEIVEEARSKQPPPSPPSRKPSTLPPLGRKPAAQANGDRVAELEAERKKLRATVEELQSALQDVRERARKADEEREKVWGELIEVMPRAEAAGALSAELESLRGALAQREGQLRERDGRLAERDAAVAAKELELAQLADELAEAQQATQTAQQAAQAAETARAAQATQAAAKAAQPVFARERELLEARRAVHERDKQILELGGAIEAHERATLDQKRETLAAERRGAELTEQILALEQTLLAANEKNAEHEREIERLSHVLQALREEREKEREQARETLAAARAAHEQAQEQLGRAHADELAALREAEAAQRAELEAQMAARLEAVRELSQKQLAAAEGRRQTDLAEAENRLAEQIRVYEQRIAEQTETFRDLKQGMIQRHAGELEELSARHALRVAELETRADELAQSLAETLDALRDARDHIELNRRRGQRAHKALAVAVALLDQQKVPGAD